MANSTTGGSPETTGADTGFTTNIGVASPGSPADEMGADVMPASGEVGAADPEAGTALTGDSEGHNRGLIDEGRPPAGGTLRPHLVQDDEPQRSNISGLTPLEEGRGS